MALVEGNQPDKNAPVRFAVEKKNLFVIDDDGKERQLDIIKRILRQRKTRPSRRRQVSPQNQIPLRSLSNR